ncbi:hypothetical protein KSP35_09935 [Aquihabitans sp. G128]|nr:hypothetical protein [Aquihabitans sp. G128]QXC63064.1 hypothetical protein KSP35_09935 [Aquihabitans sp. G128]
MLMSPNRRGELRRAGPAKEASRPWRRLRTYSATWVATCSGVVSSDHT